MICACGSPGSVSVPDGDGAIRQCWDCAGIEPTAEGVNTATFSEVIEATLPYLRRVALRLTRNASDADDVVQDAVERAFTAWERFDASRGEPRRWLAKIVKRGFLTEVRKRKLRPVSADVEMMGDDGRGLAEYLDAARGLEVLGEEQRAVLRLAMDGETYQDIADKLGIPMGTVMSRLYRARRTLEIVLQ